MRRFDQAAIVYVQDAEGAARLAAAIGRRSRVEDPNPVRGLVERYVGVPEHNELCCREPAAEPLAPARCLSAVVHHGDRCARDLELQGLRRAPRGHVGAIVIAKHHPHRSVTGELIQHACRADVPGVQDQIRGSQMPGDVPRALSPSPRGVRVRQDHCSHRGQYAR